jgi:hypothetical protein
MGVSSWPEVAIVLNRAPRLAQAKRKSPSLAPQGQKHTQIQQLENEQ